MHVRSLALLVLLPPRIPYNSMGFGQFASTSQFYLFGRKHCTSTGYDKHKAKYKDPAALDGDLTSKVFIVTGSNSGIGFEIAQFLASKKATVYMPRNPDRASLF